MLIFGRPHEDSNGQSSSVETEESRRFDSALFTALDVLSAGKVDHALIGGVAAFTHGRPRATQDIDIFVRPEDAEGALEALNKVGFKIDRFNPTWIFKAHKDGVLVDIIFRSEGNIYFDEEMRAHTVVMQYHGRSVPVVSPEDFLIIKCAAHSEEGYHHWHDATAVLSQAKIDWDYLIHRARKAPRRLLALLIYAQSVDIWVSNSHIQKLFRSIFDDNHDASAVKPRVPEKPVKPDSSDTYLAAKIKESLAKSETTGTLDIEILVQDGKILVRGQTHSDEQSRAIIDVIHRTAPKWHIENHLHTANWQAPKEIEALQ